MIKLSDVIYVAKKLWNPEQPCFHDWKYTFADRRTLVPKERKCENCGLKQVAETKWIDIKEEN